LSLVLSFGCSVSAFAWTASRMLFLRSLAWSSAGFGIIGLVGVTVIPCFGAPAVTSWSNTAWGLMVLYIGLFGPDHDMLREWAQGEPSQYESIVESPT
jgi:hypothetical protein